ncbi:FKBP-type peptidyl-prolyl cis-trans isomerase [Mucilaginibacter auburnensis]|uniref:Peptidyl-prolyl cis-trans isomerase n=1 Tax=Mucilaginibacter auburnensis TaxID=1457233 RepID=A0A2H9VTZ8_9SPHI|nr:FKBP-type peptidyl-prolyl cis-trans isomerase [Mucilaginibacter auburnensis]PJJ84281.1 FKBP-type peptidyl-prolyl cis-trans isomerase FkpA [Mucilaginibacter auburnensis]
MNRIAVTVLALFFCFTACRKTDVGSAAEKAQAIIDDKIIADYLAANPGLNAKRVDTTGVYYIVVDPGTVNTIFTTSTYVTVGYTGRVLTTGQVFAESGTFNPSFTLGSAIRGWRIGIPQIKKGGKVRLLLPSRYAYGPYAQPQLGVTYGLKDGLPGNLVLDFDISLYDAVN